MPQSLSNILIHLIWSTKDRHPWLDVGIRDQTHAFLAGAVMVAVLSSRTVKDVTSGSTLVVVAPDPSAGLTDSEPVLVSLLAGSDVDPAGADQHPAEAVLRVRDASFAELQSEVLLVVSAGVGTR